VAPTFPSLRKVPYPLKPFGLSVSLREKQLYLEANLQRCEDSAVQLAVMTGEV